MVVFETAPKHELGPLHSTLLPHTRTSTGHQRCTDLLSIRKLDRSREQSQASRSSQPYRGIFALIDVHLCGHFASYVKVFHVHHPVTLTQEELWNNLEARTHLFSSVSTAVEIDPGRTSIDHGLFFGS